MESMDFYDAVQFFPTYSDRDKIIAYAILGGIPHYLRQFDPELSLDENIKYVRDAIVDILSMKY